MSSWSRNVSLKPALHGNTNRIQLVVYSRVVYSKILPCVIHDY